MMKYNIIYFILCLSIHLKTEFRVYTLSKKITQSVNYKYLDMILKIIIIKLHNFNLHDNYN